MATLGTREFAKKNKIPFEILEEVTRECAPISYKSVKYFLQIAQEQYKNDYEFFNASRSIDNQSNKEHDPMKKDIKIFYATTTDNDFACVSYDPRSTELEDGRVIVYGKLFTKPFAYNALQTIYAQKPDIIFRQTNRQNIHTDTGLFAIMHTTTLLADNDPKKPAFNHSNLPKTNFKLNRVVGDVYLYVRLHLVEIFKNRKISHFSIE